MAYSGTKVLKQTEMTMNGNDKDTNQPYGKLKWAELVILLGAVLAATVFILFYFNL